MEGSHSGGGGKRAQYTQKGGGLGGVAYLLSLCLIPVHLCVIETVRGRCVESTLWTHDAYDMSRLLRASPMLFGRFMAP